MTSDPGDSPGSATRERRRAKGGRRRNGEPLTAAEVRSLARDRLIESRLTPNAISLTGLVLNVAAAVLVALSVWGCSNVRGRTTQMFPDCTQVSAEQQRQGKCMNRPDLPDGL